MKQQECKQDFKQNHKQDMKEQILLNNKSTVTIFCTQTWSLIYMIPTKNPWTWLPMQESWEQCKKLTFQGRVSQWQTKIGISSLQKPTNLCPNRKIGKHTKSMLSNTTSSTSDNSSIKNSQQKWTGVHHQMYQAQNMKKWILLNNKSTVTIFCNPKTWLQIYIIPMKNP